MQRLIRQTLIDELEQAVGRSQLVTVSAPAGGGVSTLLHQWRRSTAYRTLVCRCPDLSPQRPLSAFAPMADDGILGAIRSGDGAGAVDDLLDRADQGNGTVAVVIDDADHLDEASARIAMRIVERSGRVVLGHHHAPSTNPSLEMLIAHLPQEDQITVSVPPLTEPEIDVVLGDGADPSAAFAATGGNPLAVSLYRGADFASIATAVFERFDRLTADGQALAAILAASPEPLTHNLLESMGKSWHDHGTALEKSGLAAAIDGGVGLRHDKIRRVIYEELTALRRRFVHAEILGHLDGTDDLTLTMFHAVGAGDVETIVQVGPAAAEHAAEFGSHREAARHLEDVLAYEHSVPEGDRLSLRAALERQLAETAP